MFEKDQIDINFEFAIMTPKQVARYLQVSPRTVYSRWEKLGGLKVGRTLRFRKEIIDALFRPEEKKMERSGEKRTTKVFESFQNQNRSENLGSGKEKGVGKPERGSNKNRHRLVDSLQ
jgi:excisionase family DNA binding protein